jgi:hypothetical protein
VQEALHAQEACDKLAIITDDDDVYSSFDTATDLQASDTSSDSHRQQQQQQQQQQKHTSKSSSPTTPMTITSAVTGTGDAPLTVHQPVTSSHKVTLV